MTPEQPQPDQPQPQPQIVYTMPAHPVSGRAKASMIVGLVGLFVCPCGIVSAVALVLGVLGMQETKNDRQRGYGMALTGTITGGLVVATWLVFLVVGGIGILVEKARGN